MVNEGLEYETMMKLIDQAPNPELLDPVTKKEMLDPIIVSSGIVYDRSTIFDESGDLKEKSCPITKQDLKTKAFPV